MAHSKLKFRNPYHRADSDEVSHGIIDIDPLHAMIHQGKAFTLFENFDSVSFMEFQNYLFETGDKENHVIFRCFLHTDDGPVRFEFYEETDIITPEFLNIDSLGELMKGDPVVLINKNRNHDLPLEDKVFINPSVATDSADIPDGAFQLASCNIYGGDGDRIFAVEKSQHEEWVLKPNTFYLIRFKSTMGRPITHMTFGACFYEADPVELEEGEEE